MTVDLGIRGRTVQYVNFRLEGNGTNFLELERIFNYGSFAENASDYLVSVERFRVPLNTIPMLDQIDDAIVITPKGAQVPRSTDLAETYSMLDFFNQINFDPDLTFSITADAKVQIDFNFTDFYLVINPVIADIFGIEETIGDTLTGDQVIIGSTPFPDRMDQLYKLSFLATDTLTAITREIIDTDTFRSFLTDFINPTSFSLTSTMTTGAKPNQTFTFDSPIRQDLEFNDSSNRRFINFRTNTPLINMGITILANLRNGELRRIRMAKRSIGDVKLGFWKIDKKP